MVVLKQKAMRGNGFVTLGNSNFKDDLSTVYGILCMQC